MDRCARGLRVRFSIRFFSLNWYREVPEPGATCHTVRLLHPQRAARYRVLPGYRDIRANMERTSEPEGLDQYGNEQCPVRPVQERGGAAAAAAGR